MLNWLKYGQLGQTKVKKDSTMEAADNSVDQLNNQKSKGKRGSYTLVDGVTQAKVAKYASMHGNQSAVRHFASDGLPLSESTVRSWKEKYKKMSLDGPVDELPHKLSGRPLVLGDLDDLVQQYIQNLREVGGVVTRHITLAAALGIVKHKNPSLLKENGGHLDLGRGWSQSLLKRMGYSKRKATRAAKKVPPNFEQIKTEFLLRIETVVRDNKIPPDLIFNWDQTGMRYVPVSDWTLEKTGAKQVSVTGLNDKREITLLLCGTITGYLMAPQVIYAGQTTKCHPNIAFPRHWDIWHTESHWSNETSMLRYIDKVIIPYVQRKRQTPEQISLAIFDVFRAHTCQSVIKKLKDNGIYVVFVPPNCTGELQPLDLSVNDYIKRRMHDQFNDFYSNEVAKQLSAKTLEEIKVKSLLFIVWYDDPL